MKEKREIEVTVCDFCDKEIAHKGLWGGICIICGKDVCDKCSIASTMSYKSMVFYVCPNHGDLRLNQFLEILKKKVVR